MMDALLHYFAPSCLYNCSSPAGRPFVGCAALLSQVKARAPKYSHHDKNVKPENKIFLVAAHSLPSVPASTLLSLTYPAPSVTLVGQFQ